MRAAMINGLRLWSRATGTPLPGPVDDIVEQQLSAIRRACRRDDTDAATNAPVVTELSDPAADNDRFWWTRD